ncbi:MAG: fibronectin type III domain-containing protein, partial [Gemmatimonadales bacterium]
DGVMTDLTASYNAIGAAHGINATGQVIADFKWNQGCVWQAGVTRDLGSLGGPFCQPLAINDGGQIVGASVLPASGRQGTIRSFLSDGDGMHDLGSLGGIWSYAFGINRAGDVVGASSGGLTFGGNHAFLYTRGGLKDLNALIATDSGWLLQSAYGINDRGQIVGAGLHGGEQHAFLLDPPAPAAPSGLTASVLSASRAALTWTDNSTTATAFGLWRRSGSGPFIRIALLPSDTTRYTDTDLTPSASYLYHVQAINLGGASDWSNDAVAAAWPPALAPPTFLSAALGTLATARLTWSDNSDDETAFAIWRRDGAAAWARVGVVPPNSTRFIDHGLLPGATYAYRVRATNDSTPSEWSNEALLTSRPRPAAPAGLTVQVYGAGMIRLNWTGAGAEETGITLFRRAGSGDWTRIAVLPPGTIEYLDFAVRPETTYTYRLRGHNNSYASDWSNEASGTTLPLP